MSRQEALALTEWGKSWWVHVWAGPDKAGRDLQRDAIILHVNAQLNDLGFKLGRGFQDYDPVIRGKGRKPSSYVSIIQWAETKPAQEQCALAQLFLDWATGDAKALSDLPLQLLDLAIITHLAESGRGYHRANPEQLYPLMAGIAGGGRKWSDLKQDYSPSLTFKEDQTDWYSD
jgi:hypothetical protein